MTDQPTPAPAAPSDPAATPDAAVPGTAAPAAGTEAGATPPAAPADAATQSQPTPDSTTEATAEPSADAPTQASAESAAGDDAAATAPATTGAEAGSAASDSAGNAQLDEIRGGYAFDGGVLKLGATVIDNTAHADAPVQIPLAVMNRHGLVAGATGTGKTKTLQLMAEQLSDEGVPVFLADIKGDLSGLATPGAEDPKITERATSVGMQWQPKAYPTEFYSLGGMGKGIPIRATITSFGPILLSKVLGLNATQESSLGLIFHYADTNGLALLDLKDLRAVIQHLTSDEGKAELKAIGGLSSATAGVILRNLIAFENQGAEAFFGEPEFETADLLRTTADGKGVISCLELPQVQDRPQLFSTFLMWLLADLFHDLPEEGDVDKPKLVFFFDEAHLLFNDASKAFLEAIEQTVRLIRSKGVGVFFVTQSPKDVPAGVLAQLGNRVQHALRAFTPDDSKALKQAIKTYPHTQYDMEKLLTSLGIGEAVVTVLSAKGVPTPVAWTRMKAPNSLMDPSPDATVDGIISASPLSTKYAAVLDRESAYELLTAKLQASQAAAAAADAEAAAAKQAADAQAAAAKQAKEAEAAAAKQAKEAARAQKEDPGLLQQVTGSSAFKSMLRSAGTVIGREITRSIFGTRRR